MTIERLEQVYLTPLYWVRFSVVPTGLLLIAILLLYRSIAISRGDLNEVAALSGFFAFYFLVFRAGHIYMIRTMHNQLKSNFASLYEERLNGLPKQMNIRQIGAGLARIKAELHRRK